MSVRQRKCIPWIGGERVTRRESKDIYAWVQEPEDRV